MCCASRNSRSVQDAFRFFWDAPDDGQVFLAHLMLGDLGRQLAGDFWAAGKDHKAADIPVQPVDTGDKIRLAARPVLGLEQIWQPAALGRFGEDPGRLDTDEKLPVFIDDGDGQWQHWAFLPISWAGNDGLLPGIRINRTQLGYGASCRV